MRTEQIDEKIAGMIDTATPPLAPKLRERALEAMALSQTLQGGNPKRTTRLVLCAAVGVLALTLGAVLFVPREGRGLDADAVLARVAQAMEEAGSFHVVLVRPPPSETTPRGSQTVTVREEMWRSKRAAYDRFTSASGEIKTARGISLDTREAWHYDYYDYRGGYLLAADLTPILTKAAAVIEKAYESCVAAPYLKQPTQLYGYKLVGKSVTLEERAGRKVQVVSISCAPTTPQSAKWHPPFRTVYEVDPETNHLLAIRYFHTRGGKEELVRASEVIEYDTAVPADLAAVPPAAKAAKRLDVTAEVRREKTSVWLVLRWPRTKARQYLLGAPAK